MENQWNLAMLYESEDVWLQDLKTLPGRNQEILQMLPQQKAESNVESLLLLRIFRHMKELAQISANCEVWLGRLMDIYPDDRHLAELSDQLDRMNLMENYTLRCVQTMICGTSDIEKTMNEREELKEYVPFVQKLLRSPLAEESLSKNTGGGLFRLNQSMKHAVVDYHGNAVSFDMIKEISVMYDWMEQPWEEYDVLHRFYRMHGEQAGRILLEEVRRDEQDVRATGKRSDELSLQMEGLSPKVLEAILKAVDRSLPLILECRELLHGSAQPVEKETVGIEGQEQILNESTVEAEDANEEEADEDIDNRNQEILMELKEEMLTCFSSFAPSFIDTIHMCFEGGWIWIDDSERAYTNQSCARIYGSEFSYLHLPADLELAGLAHELGHAWSNRLTAHENILIWKNSLLVEYPSLLTELWERIWYLESLPHRLEQWEQELGEEHPLIDLYRRTPVAYEDFIYSAYVNLFLACSEYRFERELRRRITEEPLTVEDLAEIYVKYKCELHPDSEVEEWPGANPIGWIVNTGLYDIRQYYNLPYVISYLLAMKTLNVYRDTPMEEHMHFWNRVNHMIEEMNRRSMDELLKEYFDGDPETTDFWLDGMKILQEIRDRMTNMIQ